MGFQKYIHFPLKLLPGAQQISGVLLHMYQLAQMPDFKSWKSHQTTGA